MLEPFVAVIGTFLSGCPSFPVCPLFPSDGPFDVCVHPCKGLSSCC